MRRVCVAALLLSAAAQAQVPSAPGFKVGDGRLHPFLELDGRFDSVVGFFDKDAAGNPIPAADLLFAIRPGLRYELMSDSTSVMFAGNGEYLLYTGLLSPAAKALSEDGRGLRTNVSLETAFNKDGAVEVQVGDSLVRSDRTQNAAAGIGVLSLYNNLHLSVPIHPGGRALEITPRVSWGVEFFNPLLSGAATGCGAGDITCETNSVKQMNYSNLQFALAARWKFLPKTAVAFDSSFDLRTYFESSTANKPANVLRTQVGLVGLLTPRISLTLMAGVGHDFGLSNATAPIGQAQVSYVPTDLVTLTVGYLRSLMPVPVFGVFTDDRGFFNGKVGLLGGRFSFTGQAAFDYFSFFGTNGAAVRNDIAITVSLGPTFDVTSWFQIGANYSLGFRSSTATVSTINFVRHEAGLRLVFRY